MKKLALLSLAIACSTQEVSAQTCPEYGVNGLPTDLQALSLLGSVGGNNFHELFYTLEDGPFGQTSNRFMAQAGLLQSEGWDDASGRDRGAFAVGTAYFNMAMGVMLAMDGVQGQTPEVTEVAAPGAPIPLFQYKDPITGEIILNPAFHRSRDEWGHLIAAEKTQLCAYLNPFTGEQSCGSAGTLMYSDAEPALEINGQVVGTLDHPIYWHAPYRAKLDDYVSRSLDVTGRYEPYARFPDDPWNQVSIFCQAFGPYFYPGSGFSSFNGPVGAAKTLIHEAWHGTGYSHKNGPRDNCDLDDCDAYATGLPSRSTTYSELGRHQGAAGGNLTSSYQVASRFLCDIANSPSPWVTIAAQEMAWALEQNAADAARYYNLDSTRGLQPYTCSRPTNVLLEAVPADECVSGLCGDASDCASDQSCVFASVGFTWGCCLCVTGEPSCNADDDCSVVGQRCVNGCCQAVVR